jgi:acetate kinase
VLVEARKLLPDLPQVAAFDTAFHASIPPHAFTYPVPTQWTDEWGIRKFGFHGLSHEYCARRVTEMMAASGGNARPRVVVAHLGGGCSLSASQEGICSDTTMGFTPLDGLMMATRCGSLDPGAIIYAMRHHGLSVDDIERTLNRESGLLGVSGLSDDFRVVEKAIFSRNAKANLAFDIFAYRVRLGIGAMAAALGGIDALAFTAGIGEHSSELRSHVCREINFLGVKLDRHANEALGPDSEIGAADSRVRVFVIHAREDISIVRAVERVLSK